MRRRRTQSSRRPDVWITHLMQDDAVKCTGEHRCREINPRGGKINHGPYKLNFDRRPRIRFPRCARVPARPTFSRSWIKMTFIRFSRASSYFFFFFFFSPREKFAPTTTTKAQFDAASAILPIKLLSTGNDLSPFPCARARERIQMR